MSIYLVTGGTGTLGTALALELLARGHKVRAYARNEHRHEDLERRAPEAARSRLSCLVGDVRDAGRLRRAAEGADTLIHAAAMKIIPRCEYDPMEAVKTNVVGTMNAIEAAIDSSLQTAVLVSTDKAVAPANLYGATKLLAERMWLHANRYCGAKPGKFMAVRYGNVAGSAGSVWHVFRRANGTLPITDATMTRFHIRIEQAVALVLRAAEEARAGELWVPKLPSYQLGDLAQALAPRAQVQIIGRRPGEKIHESMISPEESCYAVEADDHYVLTPGVTRGPGGWSYHSGANEWRLTREQIQEEDRCIPT